MVPASDLLVNTALCSEDGSILRATDSETALPEGMPSVGSMLHESQQCRPCAWPLGEKC